MSKYLFIVESPNKCGKIRSFLGSDYKVMASVGHIREIPRKGLNIDIKNGFEPNYEISSGKKDVVKDIKDAAKKSEKIYLAADPDREGAAIAWSIYEILPQKDKEKCLRISFDSITKKAVQDAIADAKTIDSQQDLVNAAKARQVLDRLIGYKISPILWFKVGRGTSAGRVQSIALKYICTREKEIGEFKPQDYWYIDALLKCKEGEFKARVVTKDKDNRYLDDKVATKDLEALEKSNYSIEKIEKKEKTISPYAPFDTASLQTTCSSLFGWGVKKTASVAQSLYEKGMVTYIRTDSFNISEEALDDSRKQIDNAYGKDYLPLKPNVYKKKSKASSQEAHECIRPTHANDVGKNLEGDEDRLYELVRRRFLACQSKPMVVNTVVYYIKTSCGKKLIAKGQSVKFDGWYKIYKYSNTKEEILPNAEEKEDLDLEKLDKSKHTTQPPPRYNEGSLVKKMESEGVGRPSTYPSIMTALQTKGYVEKAKGGKGALQATDLGMRIFDYLDPRFSKDFFMDVKFTASMEDELDEIAHGSTTFLDVVEKTYEIMLREIAKTKDEPSEKHLVITDEPCPVCKKGTIVERQGKFGKFFSCDQYPECKTVFIQDEDGKFKVKESSTAKSTGQKCLVCKKGNIVLRKGPHGEFYACSAYPKCKTVFEKDEDGKLSVKQKKPYKPYSKQSSSSVIDDIE